MQQYKIKKFSGEAENNKVSDKALTETLQYFLELDTYGQHKHALGGGLYKLRIASKENRGKSGGSRSVFAFKKESYIIWLHLFSKNDKENVTEKESKKLKTLANILLNLSSNDIARLVKLNELIEVTANV